MERQPMTKTTSFNAKIAEATSVVNFKLQTSQLQKARNLWR
jgi:hypothetical protein